MHIVSENSPKRYSKFLWVTLYNKNIKIYSLPTDSNTYEEYNGKPSPFPHTIVNVVSLQYKRHIKRTHIRAANIISILKFTGMIYIAAFPRINICMAYRRVQQSVNLRHIRSTSICLPYTTTERIQHASIFPECKSVPVQVQLTFTRILRVYQGWAIQFDCTFTHVQTYLLHCSACYMVGADFYWLAYSAHWNN